MSRSPTEPQGEVSVLNPTQLLDGTDPSSYGGSWTAAEGLSPVLMGCLVCVMCYRDLRDVGLRTRLQNKIIAPHVTAVTMKI